jgi:hypothetical protein
VKKRDSRTTLGWKGFNLELDTQAYLYYPMEKMLMLWTLFRVKGMRELGCLDGVET